MKRRPQCLADSLPMSCCRYANRSVGFQERMVMERKMLEAAEQGKPLPDIPGMESVKDDIISQNPTLAAHIPDVQPGDAGNPKV